MGKNSRSRSAVSQAKHFVLGAGLVLVLATVLPALAQQNPGGGGAPPPGGGAPPPGGGGSSPVINLPSLDNLTTPGLPFTPTTTVPGGTQAGQQPQKGSLINVPDASGILKDALKQAQQPQQQGEEGSQLDFGKIGRAVKELKQPDEEGSTGITFPGKGATKGVFPGKGATLGKFPGIGKGVSGEPKGEDEGSGEKDFSGVLKKADAFGKRGIAPLPFKKGKATEEGTEAPPPSETPTEAPAVTEESTPVTEPTGEEAAAPSRRPQVKGRSTEKLDKLPGFSRGVGGSEGTQTEEGAPSPQLFDPKQYKQFVDKDLMKLFGKKPVKPAIQLPEIEEGGGLEEDAQVFGQYLERLLKAGRKLSKKSLRQNSIGFYSQVSKWCTDEEVDCGDELNELKYAIRKGSKKDLLQTLTDTWQAIQEKVLSGGEEEEEEEFFEEEEF